MLWKRHDEAKRLPKVAVCCMDSDETRAVADALTRRGECEPIAILSDTPEDILWLCARKAPDILVLEAAPNAMERFDDPARDISGRCEMAVRVREEVPDCRAYLTCDAAFRHLESVLQKAVETELIRGYCFGTLTERQVKRWLAEL